jgi:hypothetical protein
MTQPQLPIPDPVATREQSQRHISNMLAILKGEHHERSSHANTSQPSQPRQARG